MQVLNRKLLKNILFDDYLKIPGLSFSGIQSEGVGVFSPTKKMELGTQVHTYLLTPRDYDYRNIELVKPLAAALKARLGCLLEYTLPEVVVTADFCCNGFSMPYKGRIDLGIPKKLVIDIKVSEQPLKKGIEYFKYDRQVSGYAIGIEAKAALIVSIHPKTFQITIYNVPIETHWWEYVVTQKGRVIK